MNKFTLLLGFCCLIAHNFFGQVVINELFPDPNPAVGLPEEEFVELYNSSSTAINLENFTLSDPTKTAVLPNFMLNANDYIIICASGKEALFTGFGNALGVTDFPTLNNSGDIITLEDNVGQIIDQIDYQTSWYQDPIKDNGGWTLERINPLNLCDGEQNWRASNNSAGGSPGSENSIFDSAFFDNSEIVVLSSIVNPANVVTLTFNRTLNVQQAQNTATFSVTPSIPIISAFYDAQVLTVKLLLGNPIPENTLYELTIQNLEDCNALQTLNTTVPLALPIKPQRGEILLNELLFNPESGGEDFVEIVNVSENIFSLQNLSFLKLESNFTIDFVVLDAKQLLLPGEFWVITEDAAHVIDVYNAQPQFIIEDNLPNYPDDSGKIALLNSTLDTLDVLAYSKEWHSPLISNEDGVSLERLSLQIETQQQENWTSAALTSGNATPTYSNSNVYVPAISTNPFSLSGEYFTPDRDGNEDLLFITLDQDVAQLTGTLQVFNVRGVAEKTLLNNQLIGNQFTLRWDGLDDDGQELPLGHYIILLTTFDENGNTNRYKESVVLSRKAY